MDKPFDLLATWYGQVGLGGLFIGLFLFVIWRVYKDMRNDRKVYMAVASECQAKHEKMQERTVTCLEGNVSTRRDLIVALNRLANSHESLPCNMERPPARRYLSPRDGTSPTPPKGNPQ